MRIIAGQLQSRRLQMVTRHVDRHIGDWIGQGVEQVARFDAAAAAKFNQHRAATDPRAHRRREPVHNRQLGAGQIILVQLADAIEQL